MIEISDVNKQHDGSYRLVYDPPYGYPPPNTTISSREIGDSIQFSNGLPGTNYNFWLYYTNQTHRDWLTWRVSITTGKYLASSLSIRRPSRLESKIKRANLTTKLAFPAPDPPSNLSVTVRSGKMATITWSPPTQGNYTSFKLKILGLSDYSYANKTITIDDDSFQHQMKDLTPGATYQIQAYTIFDGKESVAYTSRNFTTSESDGESLLLTRLLLNPQ